MIGHARDKRWIEDNVERLPYRFRRPLLAQYQRRYDDEGRRAANLSILALREAVEGAPWSLTSDDSALIQWAERRAESAQRVAGRFRPPESIWDPAYLAMRGFCEASGVAPEEVSRTRTLPGAMARMQCPIWWRRRVRTGHSRRVESAAIGLGLVHRRAGIYCSDETVDRRRSQRSRNQKILESILAVNELGQSYTLEELAALSVSNPTIRRGELMTRMSGFERYADHLGHVGMFYTWTCPSKMHWNSDKFDGTTPRDAQAHLCLMWSRARAALRRAGLNIYGFRVAEPHHDGCPHWHMLMFMAADDVDAVTSIFRAYALQVDGDEQGADKHRFEAVRINKNRGTATGYLAKYVAKNIDGFGMDYVDEDLTQARDPRECARRVDAWASAWGIRQFQQIGGPSVTLWRELRRLRDEVESEEIEKARAAADAGDWWEFCRVASGLELAKAWNDRPGQYGEPLGDQVIGVQCGSVMVPTRVHEWRIERGRGNAKRSGTGNVESHVGSGKFDIEYFGGSERPYTVHCADGSSKGDPEKLCTGVREAGQSSIYDLGFLGRGEAVATWSPVNNCTGVVNEFGGKSGVGGGRGGAGGESDRIHASQDRPLHFGAGVGCGGVGKTGGSTGETG